LKRRRWLPRGLGVGYCALGMFLASSCYRAEIDLTNLMGTDSASGAGAPTMSGAAATTVSGASASSQGGGGSATSDAGGSATSEAGRGGEGGGAVAVECDASPLDDLQWSCSYLGRPSREACLQQEENGELSGWQGCYDGACNACTKLLRDYPYYFAWHPCCRANDTCKSNTPVHCAVACPAPSERDKHPRCPEQKDEKKE
jgi:hypothetical protein